jgi:hypothetical protein
MMRMVSWADRRGGGTTWARRAPLAALGCLIALVVACYGGALFGGRQFAFRDSAHFYYPLHWRIQQEWSAGRLPLWEPGANGGQPMLGSPMAAVLYPAKLIFEQLPAGLGRDRKLALSRQASGVRRARPLTLASDLMGVRGASEGAT